MRFQCVVRSVALLACTAVAACATTSPQQTAAVHIAAPEAPTSFTRLEITQNYSYAPSAPLPAAAGGDPSFSRAQEEAMARLAPGDPFAHAAVADWSKDVRRMSDGAPEGWDRTPNDTVRHRLSGLNCPVTIDITEENRRYLLVQTMSFDQRNHEAGCLYRTGDGGILALFANYWPEMSIEQSLAGSIEAIAHQFDVKGDLPVSIAALEGEDGDPVFAGLETPLAGGFDIGEINGFPYKTSLWLVKTHGWHVKARATYTQEDVSSEMISAIMFAVSHLSVRAKNIAEPVSAGEI